SAKTDSTSAFVTALVFNAAVFSAEILAFSLLRPRFKQIYESRSQDALPSSSKRAAALSRTFYSWPLALYKADYRDILRVNGLDAYFFVHYLRMMVRILLPIWFFSWVILLPVTSVNSQVAKHSGLDRFVFGNVAPDRQSRYWAHLVLAWLFTGWVLYNIRKELRYYVKMRHCHLADKAYASSAQAKTLLITGVPEDHLSEKCLTDLLSHFPGGVRKVWLNRDLKDLPDKFDSLLKAYATLESAETSLIRTAMKLRIKALKIEGKQSKGRSRSMSEDTAVDPIRANADAEAGLDLAEKLVPKNKRPTHRLGPNFLPFSVPFVGKTVDSIDWARDEIVQLTADIEKGRSMVLHDHSDSHIDKTSAMAYPPLNSVFVLFETQVAAHLAKAALLHHQPYAMAERHLDICKEDVIWNNLGMNPYSKSVRTAVSWAATAGLILFWAIPVAFVGAVSNIHSLCATASWLAWICRLPSVVVGIIQGILPPALLAVLSLLLPVVLRLLARFEGIPTYTGVELSLMTRYFWYQVVNSFLIVTLSSGIIAALPGLINNPGSIPSVLAENLPSASNFFITYILLQGLSGTASGFLQASTLVLYYVKLFVLGSTPRSIYNIKYGRGSLSWGTTFPGMTLFVVVAMAYMIISPIINGFACAAFCLFYFLYKYLLLWVFEQPREGETGGLFFPKALQHILVGLYIQQVALAALFFLAQNAQHKQSSIGEGVLMIILIVVTAFFHYTLNRSHAPLLEALPLTLAQPASHPRQQTGGTGTANQDDNATLRVDEVGSTSETMAEGESPGRVSEKDNDLHAFDHPALVDAPRVVWMPKDPLGLGDAEVEANNKRGIQASVAGTEVDEKGGVDVSSPPPDCEDCHV
ncbi:DUF221-domain-containing protein, partial [Gloeophyllum trabeum ATCC 11539]